MTESEWMECDKPSKMLGDLYGKGDRKLRLVACAYSRKVWHLLADRRSQNAVEVAERFADGRASEQERKDAVHPANKAAFELIAPEQRRVVSAWGVPPDSPDACAALAATAAAYSDDAVHNAAIETLHHTLRILSGGNHYSEDDRASARLVREIFGNPFRPPTTDSIWLTPTVSDLAQAAYEERALPSGELDPARLAVLSDALEEAGCDDAEIHAHLRGPGPHVRGCWVVDLLLGRE